MTLHRKRGRPPLNRPAFDSGTLELNRHKVLGIGKLGLDYLYECHLIDENHYRTGCRIKKLYESITFLIEGPALSRNSYRDKNVRGRSPQELTLSQKKMELEWRRLYDRLKNIPPDLSRLLRKTVLEEASISLKRTLILHHKDLNSLLETLSHKL